MRVSRALLFLPRLRSQLGILRWLLLLAGVIGVVVSALSDRLLRLLMMLLVLMR